MHKMELQGAKAFFPAHNFAMCPLFGHKFSVTQRHVAGIARFLLK